MSHTIGGSVEVVRLDARIYLARGTDVDIHVGRVFGIDGQRTELSGVGRSWERDILPALRSVGATVEPAILGQRIEEGDGLCFARQTEQE
jgi:hypothetical protein